APMRETLVKYQDRLKEVEDKRANMFGAINAAIGDVKAGQLRVTEEAQRIVHSLRNAPKARGRWGEHQLRRVLEMAGLSQHCDFAEEVHVENEDGARRPDVVVNLPGERVLVIDAKCSLVAYQDAVGAESEEERLAHMLVHAKALKTHVNMLSSKDYLGQFDDTLDFVIMFVPGENFLSAALEVDQGLFEHAFEKRVLLASPTNLIAIARTVAMVWQQEKAAENVREIAALGKELYERLATMGEHVARVGKNLDQATGAYNKMVGSLESQVLTSARRFRDLEIDPPKKEIDALDMAVTEPRQLTKLDPDAMREAAE
ncbi:MAG: DNA recombination protein RmuC, partial [Pseudomonadota bacterium]